MALIQKFKEEFETKDLKADSLVYEEIIPYADEATNFLSKKNGTFSPTPRRKRPADDITAKLPIPVVPRIKPSWEKDGVESDEELNQFALAVMNEGVGKRRQEFMVITSTTLSYQNKVWSFHGSEFYRLIAVTKGQDDKLLYYFEAVGAGIAPKKLFGVGGGTVSKLFGGNAVNTISVILGDAINRSESYNQAREKLKQKQLSEHYAEQGIEFGGW